MLNGNYVRPLNPRLSYMFSLFVTCIRFMTQPIYILMRCDDLVLLVSLSPHQPLIYNTCTLHNALNYNASVTVQFASVWVHQPPLCKFEPVIFRPSGLILTSKLESLSWVEMRWLKSGMSLISILESQVIVTHPPAGRKQPRVCRACDVSRFAARSPITIVNQLGVAWGYKRSRRRLWGWNSRDSLQNAVLKRQTTAAER